MRVWGEDGERKVKKGSDLPKPGYVWAQVISVHPKNSPERRLAAAAAAIEQMRKLRVGRRSAKPFPEKPNIKKFRLGR